MNKEHKRKIAYEVLIFLGVLGILTLVTRMWPILLLIILGIFVAALRLLFLSATRVEPIEPLMLPAPPGRPETEKDLLRRAYGLIEQRITNELVALHSSARWHWLNPNAMASLERGEALHIILKGSGGHRKASVQVRNLMFVGLAYETVQPTTPSSQQNPATDPDTGIDIKPEHEPDADAEDFDAPEESESVNYGYLAFEWVDTHLLSLNTLSNEAIGKGQRTLLIPKEDLPSIESWQDICKQLIQNDFYDAVTNEDGIRVSLQQ